MFPEPTTLVGGYYCKVTFEQRNDWAKHVRSSPLYEKYEIAKNLLTHLIRNGTLNEIREITKTLLEVENSLYFLGEEWFENLKEKNETFDAVPVPN